MTGLKMKKFFLYAAIFSLFFLLCTQFPFVSDDWLWGSDPRFTTFIDSFTNPDNELHYNNNGRYLGNFLGFLNANNYWLRNIMMSACLTAMVFLISHISSQNNSVMEMNGESENGHFLRTAVASGFSFLLIMICSRDRFRQVIAWNSAFMIYGIASALFLACFFLLFCIPKRCQIKERLLCIGALIIPLVASFFSENLTIGNLIFSVLFILYQLMCRKKIQKYYYFYLAGALLGLCLMFSDDGYSAIMQGNEEKTYQSVPAHSVLDMLRAAKKNYFGVFTYELMRDNTLLNMVISGLCALLAFLSCRKRRAESIGCRRLMIICSVCANLLFSIWYLLRALYPTWLAFFSTKDYLDGCIMPVFYLNLAVICFFCVEDRINRGRMLFCLLFIICFSLPLLVATPLSSRVFFPMYIFLSLFCAELFNRVLFFFPRNDYLLPLTAFLFTLCLSFYIFWLSIYLGIHHYDVERLSYVREREAQGDTTIWLPKLPNEEFLIVSFPYGDWVERYKKFYGFDEDTDLHIVEYAEWVDMLNAGNR